MQYYFIILALWANFSVEFVSKNEHEEGDTFAIINVFALPPKEFFRR